MARRDALAAESDAAQRSRRAPLAAPGAPPPPPPGHHHGAARAPPPPPPPGARGFLDREFYPRWHVSASSARARRRARRSGRRARARGADRRVRAHSARRGASRTRARARSRRRGRQALVGAGCSRRLSLAALALGVVGAARAARRPRRRRCSARANLAPLVVEAVFALYLAATFDADRRVRAAQERPADDDDTDDDDDGGGARWRMPRRARRPIPRPRRAATAAAASARARRRSSSTPRASGSRCDLADDAADGDGADPTVAPRQLALLRFFQFMIAVLVADCALLQRANCSEAAVTRRELLLSATRLYKLGRARVLRQRPRAAFLAAGFGGGAADDGGNAGVSNNRRVR